MITQTEHCLHRDAHPQSPEPMDALLNMTRGGCADVFQDIKEEITQNCLGMPVNAGKSWSTRGERARVRGCMRTEGQRDRGIKAQEEGFDVTAGQAPPVASSRWKRQKVHSPLRLTVGV